MTSLNEEPIETGSFKIKSLGNGKLVSYLGSCVGVILIDKVSGIGGMYHILLPEPLSAYDAQNSRNFASIGMPEFLHQFFSFGGKKQNTEVIIAGGALLGPVSQQDLDFDIGGRITEIVTNIIMNESIKIKESVTGGYFGTRLELNLNNLEYLVSAIGEKYSSREKLIKQAQEIDIDTAISRVRPIPQIALKIVRMINSEEYTMSKIAMEIRKDQVIGAKVIQLCNSAFGGLSNRIKSIDQGLVLLGEKALLKIVLQSSVEVYFQEIGQGYSLTKGGLYYHALATATVSEYLANQTGKEKPDIAYTAGLLHDIGKVVLDQYVAQIFPTFFERVFTDKQNLSEVEEKLIGINHMQAGSRLAELWDLPDVLQESIAFHHSPEKAKGYPDVTHIVYLADFILSRYHMGHEIERMDTDNFNDRLAKIGLKPQNFSELINNLPWKEINSYM